MVGHSEILLSKCAQFRKQGEFIDVGLKVGEEIFSAHRIVLAASSDYFHAMFAHGMKESNQEVIELKDEGISAAALKIVLDSIYRGNLQVNDENVFEVLVAADHVQVTSVVQQCCDYLQTHFVDQLRFDVQTYCRVSAIADRHVDRHDRLKTFKKPRRLRWPPFTKTSAKVKNSCPMWMLISTLAFFVEMISVLLQRHSSLNL